MSQSSIVDVICERALEIAPEVPWLVEPLTPGRGQAFILQHILRNRLFSAVIRPAWISRCPDLAIVRKTIGQMREELVFDDEIAQPHTTLLWEMGRNVGLTNEEMDNTRAVPLVDIALNVWEHIARSKHWVAGWLATSVDEFMLTAMSGEHNYRPEAWQATFQLNDEQVFFFSYHTKADDDHAGRKVWEPIARHVTTEAERREVLDGMELALTADKLFYQGICELGDHIDASKNAA